ncbi:hypothetical protein CCS41_08610 [Candidatus Fukatsuia symbiotica]|uniref:Uncharacterized protein n=1 Tax=Candidatus Fukatsuia symbiotica TaxID=1878942 RepID=A0A2U8I5T3_9GAMM|nr:hypothetical protein CCS41_08610 [Candidatus Fukatsuia symbiotica]
MLLTLAGLEQHIKQAVPKKSDKVNFISYPDDFVITLCINKSVGEYDKTVNTRVPKKTWFVTLDREENDYAY